MIAVKYLVVRGGGIIRYQLQVNYHIKKRRKKEMNLPLKPGELSMGLRRVDEELSKGNHKAALSLIKRMQGKPGGLRGFGIASAKPVPQRTASLNHLERSGIDIFSLESSRGLILKSIESSATLRLSDEVSLVELESLMHERTYESLCQDHLMCMQHEAGHFLVGYLLGLLPKRYVVSNMDTLRTDKLAVSGGSVQFLDFEFLRDIHAGKRSNEKFSRRRLDDVLLDKFMCVILAGLVTEHMVFGFSQGFQSDLDTLDKVIKWMGLTDIEASNGVKWAISNTIVLLNTHREARSRLAEAMGLGKSVGSCIEVIENNLNDVDM